ncbi:MAG: hypothetical protein Q8O92_04570 [Candidatus Latescibacter sp.]|nr:hypothetical protein [Candidatus Latescibacter sp.]
MPNLLPLRENDESAAHLLATVSASILKRNEIQYVVKYKIRALFFYIIQKGEMMEQGKDFNQMAKERYAEIQRQEVELMAKLEEIQKQKGPLKAYLQGAGLIEVRRRGPRKKKNVENPQ